MTPTIELICGHRSIRHFTDEPISEAQREAIINSARATSSSSFLQCSSIIRITDKALREELVTLTGGQKHVAQAAEFWVFCADFNRHLQICPDAQLGLAEQLLLGVVDTAMMAQNALTAAESLGLGGVYIGGLRNNIEAVTELLKLPQHVLPLFGLCRSFYRKRLYKIMTSLVVPGLDTLRQWLDDLGMSFFECDNCQALHLPHMQNFDGVFDAKIDLIDNTILFSAMAEVRPSAVLPLAADLSAINASSLTVKAFLDMQDDNLPKLVVCQSLSVMQGVTYEQFAWFVRQSEEQISMVILEANAHQLLLPTDDEGQNNVTENYFLH